MKKWYEVKKIDRVKGYFERLIRYRWAKLLAVILALLMICGTVYQHFFESKDVEKTVGAYKIEENPQNKCFLSIKNIRTLNPLVSIDEDTRYLTPLIYSGLFSLDEHLTPVEDLVESYSFSKNKLTVKLKNVKWHDERNLTGEDVEFSYDVIKSVGDAGMYRKTADKIDKVVGSGDKVEIHFADAKDISLSYLTFPIVPKHKYSSVKEFKNDVDNFIPVGSGMYKVGKADLVNGFTLSPNENYYGERARSIIDVKVANITKDNMNLVESGNISLLLSKLPERKALIKKKAVKIQNFPSNQMEILHMNTKKPFTSDENVRKALISAVDIQSIIDESYYGSAVKNDGLFLNNYMGAKRTSSYKFSKEDAVDYLKKAGYTDKNSDGRAEDEKGKSISLTMIVSERDESRAKAADEIAKSIGDIGVDISLQKLSDEEVKQRLVSGEYNIYLGGMSIDESMDIRSLVKKGAVNNFTGYANDDVDRGLDRIYSGLRPSESKDAILKIEKKIEEDAVYYCICYRTYGIVKAPAFAGSLSPNFVNPYGGSGTWYSKFEKRVIENVEVETPKSQTSEE